MLTIKHLRTQTRHRPSHARIHLRRRSVTRFGSLVLCAAALGMLLITPGAVADTGVNITTVEGQSFTGTVVSGLLCPLQSATIDWGDGTTSAGTDDGAGGIQGTHTYAEEGTYSASVSYTYSPLHCEVTPPPATFQATVTDAALTWTGHNVAGTAGQSLGGVVAHFSDANPAAGAGDFSAQISWGDGASSPGSVSAAAGGGFDVSGSHTYASAGSYTVSVAVTDVGGSTATTSSTAQIAAAPPPPPQITASFIVNPSSPCIFTKTQLDARDSILIPGGTNTAYDWSIDGNDAYLPTQGPVTVVPPGGFGYQIVKETSLGQAYHDTPGYGAVLYNVFILHLRASPVDVSLDVSQTVPGRGLVYEAGPSPVRRITFTNPDITAKIGDPGSSISGAGPPIWIINAGQQHGCPHITSRRFFGIPGIPNSAALAKLAHAAVVLAPGPSIKLQVGCKNLVKDCFASLDVLSRALTLTHAARTRGHRPLPPSLGTKTFVVPAGKTISVRVPLNARGRALVRARKLHRVTLLLGSVGAGGKIVPTIRTVRLRGRR